MEGRKMSMPSEDTSAPIEMPEETATSTDEITRPAGPAQKSADPAPASPLVAIIPEELMPLYWSPALYITEESEAYFALVHLLLGGNVPNDPIAKMILLQIPPIDLEKRRLRKLKASIIDMERYRRGGSPNDVEAEAATARAFLIQLPFYERIDKLLEAQELRLSELLQELRNHLDWLSRTPKYKYDVVDAEYSESPPPKKPGDTPRS
jgi:hypothetical protein